jgi:hypothetical protein
MEKLILFISLLFFSLSGVSQIITVTGHVADYQNDGVRSVKIIYGNKFNEFTATDKIGGFRFKIDLKKLDTVQFIHVAYEVKTVILSKRLIKSIENDTLKLDVLLHDMELGIIEVGVKKPDTLFGTQQFSIADYELTHDGNLILLSYEKNIKKGSKLRLLNEEMVQIDSYIILDECIELKSDFRNNIHLITTENVYLINIENGLFHVYREDKDYYYKFLAPVVDTLNDRIYYSNYSAIYPAFDYMEFNKTDSVYKKMLEVKDKPLMEQYRAEFKFTDVRTKIWAHNKQIETGIDKEIWVGAAVFTKTVYYTPLYAPLFVQNDSVLIFDHYDNKLIKYTPNKGVIESVKIKYHFNSRKSGWEQPLIQDKEGGKIYALFMRNGFTFLSLLDTNTGQIIKTYKLYYKYIEKIQIINNEVFYIYRPYESVQKKYIYKEELK